MSEPSPQVSVSPGPVEVATTLRQPEGEAALDGSPARVVIPAELAAGRILAERYTVLGFLGQGGMGLVLAAYDARLDRRVALKLLRQRGDGSGGGEERARLVREAQSMARLNHPNVVAVYDSGTLADGSLFIAMEYVQGETLRQWCARQRRSWREILATYVEAGRGLAAAHAAGLIHRDFKPETGCPAQTALLPPFGRILANRDVLSRVQRRVMSRHAATLATAWQRAARSCACRGARAFSAQPSVPPNLFVTSA